MSTANSAVVDIDRLAEVERRLAAEQERRIAENALAHYTPFPKQAEFHAAGAKYRERLLIAGNQVGKSKAANMEVAIHATGLYPLWWVGKRFDHALRIWSCCESNEVIRDTTQKLLLGETGQHGTGCIPRAALLEVVPARGIAELADIIRVQHVSGGVSTIALKAYTQGRERFQGSTIDYLSLDEEPPPDIFSEALTRTSVTQGPATLVFTPLKGMSTVVRRYLMEPSPSRTVITMTLDDALQYTAEARAAVIEQHPEHERDARVRGIPTMGSGRVFNVPEVEIVVDPFECPKHWIKLGGVDFGWSHFAAFCELWHDRDRDVIYLVRTLRLREQTPLQHVEAVRGWGLIWAWPHDGRNQTLAGAGVPLMQQYAAGGLDMMFGHATFPDGGNSVEAGVQMMHDRMRGGRWKVFRGQNDGWLEEYRLYHRDPNGLLVKEGDDAISASRYAMMMAREGKTLAPPKPREVFYARGSGAWMAS